MDHGVHFSYFFDIFMSLLGHTTKNKSQNGNLGDTLVAMIVTMTVLELEIL